MLRWFFLFLFLMFFPLSDSLARVNGKAFVASSHPLATRAGENILKKGGTAADAAVAMALSLSVLQPEQSGLGGGGIALYHDAGQNDFVFVDYMEAYPNSKIKDFVYGKESDVFAVPGFAAGLEKIHQRFGRLDWSGLFEDAMLHARDGFELNRDEVLDYQSRVKALPPDDFLRLAVESLPLKKVVLKQQNLFQSLERLSREGAKDFYQGQMARELAQEFKNLNSAISAEDLAFYQVRFVKPRMLYYRDLRLLVAERPSFSGALLQSFLQATVSQVSLAELKTLATVETKNFFKQKEWDDRTEIGRSESVARVLVRDRSGNVAVMLNTLHGVWGSRQSLSNFGFFLNQAQIVPALIHSPKTSDANDEAQLKKRPISFLSLVIVLRGFDQMGIFAAADVAGVAEIFQTMIPYYFLSEKTSALVKRLSSPFLFVHQKKNAIESVVYPKNKELLQVVKD